jgi:hypothetical protein
VTLERIVRPFQLGDISPPKPVASGTSSAPQTNIIKYGESGTAKLLFGSETIDESFYAVKKMREKPKPVDA